jgi:hypothetical protein
MAPSDERQSVALPLRIKKWVSGFISPSVLSMTSLSNIAEANINPSVGVAVKIAEPNSPGGGKPPLIHSTRHFVSV